MAVSTQGKFTKKIRAIENNRRCEECGGRVEMVYEKATYYIVCIKCGSKDRMK